MKLILLAAAALIAVPAMAQETPAPADPAMQAPPAPGADPVGGYQPSAPPMTGTVTPGVPVVFKQAPDPTTAYPPPAPLEKYPVCKKGQFDKCINRGGK